VHDAAGRFAGIPLALPPSYRNVTRGREYRSRREGGALKVVPESAGAVPGRRAMAAGALGTHRHRRPVSCWVGSTPRARSRTRCGSTRVPRRTLWRRWASRDSEGATDSRDAIAGVERSRSSDSVSGPAHSASGAAGPRRRRWRADRSARRAPRARITPVVDRDDFPRYRPRSRGNAQPRHSVRRGTRVEPHLVRERARRRRANPARGQASVTVGRAPPRAIARRPRHRSGALRPHLESAALIDASDTPAPASPFR